MSEYLVICGCSGMQHRAESAFKIAFPRKATPTVCKGKSQIAQLAGQRSGTDLSRYLLAISKKSGKFAYYIEEDNGTVTMNYDLLKGKKVG